MDNSKQAPATDDQELAKVLESMNTNAMVTPTPVIPPDPPTATTEPTMDFEETPSAPVVSYDTPVAMTEPTSTPEPPAPVQPTYPAPLSGDLDSIKKDALAELRPLVDKLDLPATEKFDTLLLIIRSTDDKSLVAAAHEAAKAIEDESKRAEALLDVIKEIDFFSSQDGQATS